MQPAPRSEDIESTFSSGFDDEGCLWFGCVLKDGRLVTVCFELDQCIALEGI